MTTQIVIGNGYGLAIATDSAVTVGNRRTYETSEKLICIPTPHSVAVLVSGAVTQYGLPIQVIIREWVDGLGSTRLRKLSDYRDNFTDWLRDSSSEFPNPEYRSVDAFWSVDRYLRQCWQSSSGDERHEGIGARTNAALQFLEHWIERHKGFDRIDHFNEMGGAVAARRVIDEMWDNKPDHWPGLASRIEFWFDDIDPAQLARVMSLVRELLVERLSTWWLLGDTTTVAFAGYGEKELIPSIAEVVFFGSYRGWVASLSHECQQAMTMSNGYFLMRTLGQTDYIENILRGYRTDLIESAVGALRQANNTTPHHPSSSTEQDVVAPEQTPPDVEKTLWSAVHDDSEERLLGPLRQAVAAMPMRSLADAARSLVGVQILGNAISAELPTTGGAIEVATITRSGGVQLH